MNELERITAFTVCIRFKGNRVLVFISMRRGAKHCQASSKRVIHEGLLKQSSDKGFV